MKRLLLTAATSFLIFIANAQWLSQNAGFTNDVLGFYEMSIVNKNTVWAVCYDGRLGLNNGRFILDFTRTTDGGNTWIPGKMGNDHSLQFSNISAVSEDEAWVAMNKRFTYGGGLYHTTDGGVTWAQAGVGEIFDENSFPNFVHFKDRNKGIAMGDPNNGYFEIYTTTNKGKKWKRVPEADLPPIVPGEFGWISGFYAVGETVWFGTSAGRIYKTTNFGKDWTVSTVDPDGKFVNEIAFNDDMMRGVAHLRGVGGTFLYATTDGGATWTLVGQPLNWKRSRLTAVPGTDALISTSVIPFDPGSAVSYDNGATWTEIERTTQKAVARFFDAGTGWSGGFHISIPGAPFNGGIYKSQIAFEQQAVANKGRSDEDPGLWKRSIIENEKMLAQLVKIYPTPANDVINVTLPDESLGVISILTTDGKLLESKRIMGSRLVQFNVSKLPAGQYILRIFTKTQAIGKVITIQR